MSAPRKPRSAVSGTSCFWRGSQGLERITQQWGPKATALVAAPNDDDFIAADTSAYNSEVNEFFNRVRHHLNVEDITFEFINLDPDTRA